VSSPTEAFDAIESSLRLQEIAKLTGDSSPKTVSDYLEYRERLREEQNKEQEEEE